MSEIENTLDGLMEHQTWQRTNELRIYSTEAIPSKIHREKKLQNNNNTALAGCDMTSSDLMCVCNQSPPKREEDEKKKYLKEKEKRTEKLLTLMKI